MNYQWAAIVLAPLLVAQGLYVRYTTPRLPEPAGERSGLEGSGPDLRLLVLGDSAAAGVGVSHQGQALSGQLVLALGADFRIAWNLIAQTGRKAADVAAQLEALPPARYDVAVTSIGVNDVTHGTRKAKWVEHLSRIVGVLQTKFHIRHIIISGLPPMHLFPALPQPLRWHIGKRAEELNSAARNYIAGCTGCEFVTIDYPLETAYMAMDGFHPGAPAYALWAQHLAHIIRLRLTEA